MTCIDFGGQKRTKLHILLIYVGTQQGFSETPYTEIAVKVIYCSKFRSKLLFTSPQTKYILNLFDLCCKRTKFICMSSNSSCVCIHLVVNIIRQCNESNTYTPNL